MLKNIPSSNKELIVVHEDTFVLRGIEINYAVVESGFVLIAYANVIKLLGTNASELKDIPLVVFSSPAKKKWNNGLYLKEIPQIFCDIAITSKNETLAKKAKDLLEEFSYMALKNFTGEKDIIEEEKPEPRFNQLPGALMKVPPPKNEK